MPKEDIDAYLATLDDQKRRTLEKLRQTILHIVPEAQEGLSYDLPAFTLGGKTIAGFGAFNNHLSYFPHSGAVFPELAADVAPYVTSKGALRFEVDTPLPKELVEKLITVRRRHLGI